MVNRGNWVFVWGLAVVSAGVIWGCGDDSTSGKLPDGKDPIEKGGHCGSTAECVEGLSCHEGVCQELAGIGGRCAPNEFIVCTAGECLEGICSLVAGGCQCASDEVCVEGDCLRISGIGGPCRDTVQCSEGVCVEGVCRAEAGEGEGCGAGIVCQEGLVCSQQSRTCISLPSFGEPCDDRDGCYDGYVCWYDVCATLSAPLGAPCDDVIVICDYTAGLSCMDGMCRKPSYMGEACDDQRPCSDGRSLCLGGKCIENRGECDSDDDCIRDSYCCLKPECDFDRVCIPYGEGPRGDIDETCQFTTIPGLFDAAIQCEWLGPEKDDPYPNHPSATSVPLVMKTPHDSGGSNEIIFISFNGSSAAGGGGDLSIHGSDLRWYGVIRIINGETCELHESIFDDDHRIPGGSNLAMADVDGDGWPEIFASRAMTQKAGVGVNGIVAFRWDDTQKKYVTWWHATSPSRLGRGGPSVHMIDGAPVVVGARGNVFDALTGTRLNPGQEIGSEDAIPILADLDGDGKIEFITAGTIYRWNSETKRWDPAYTGLRISGVQFAYADFGTRNPDGSFDFDNLDGRAEVMSCGGGNVRLSTLEGELLMEVTGMMGGGPCTVGDFNGDGRPEIGVAFGDYMRVFDPLCEAGVDGCLRKYVRWEQPAQDRSSAATGALLFDFDGDGRMESVYGDECFVRVYDGSTGDVLFSSARTSITWYEMPVVADVDNDESAELIVNSNSGHPCDNTVDPVHRGLRCASNADCFSGQCEAGLCRCTTDNACNSRRDASGQMLKEYACVDGINAADRVDGKVCRAYRPPGVQMTGIRVLRDRLDRWVSSRNLWNQHAYSITNINDDMTLPKGVDWIQNFLVPGLNNYRQNTQGLVGRNAAPDITGRFTDNTCVRYGTKIVLGAEICNRGTKMVASLMPATFYFINEDDSREKLCTSYTSANVPVGGCLRVSCEIEEEFRGRIVMVANDDGFGGSTTVECNANNNEDFTIVADCPVN